VIGCQVPTSPADAEAAKDEDARVPSRLNGTPLARPAYRLLAFLMPSALFGEARAIPGRGY